ncbi:MAG TPA: hypothetical protein ENI20_14345 [Bacteroides sp.]|nr:hypothetical protein [Bacteroides sp.]
MENAIPYCRDLYLDVGTKKLILNLLSSIRSVVPVAGPPGPDSPTDTSGLKDLEKIRNLLIRARQHSDELEGIFNPDELQRYTRYVSDYQDIMSQMEKLLEELKNCRDSALNYASGMAVLVEWHLRMTNSPDEDNLTDSETIKLKVV